MATDTRIRIRRNPYHGFEVWLWGNGELTRRSFDNSIDLSAKLADECVSDRDIEDACDKFERLEWQEPEYPLLQPPIVYCDDAPVCAVPFDQPEEPSPYWQWAAATLHVGAIFGPWALLMILGRMAWGWL